MEGPSFTFDFKRLIKETIQFNLAEHCLLLHVNKLVSGKPDLKMDFECSPSTRER